MKQETTLQKLNKGKALTDSGFMINLKDLLYPFLMFLTGTKVRYKVEKVNECEILPDKPVIYVANHGAFPDTPIMLRATGRRSYIFSGKQNLAFIDWVFFVLNGVIWVDRKDKEDMAASKEALFAYLRKGRSILWFPEGTWNLTQNQLMMHMKWGVIEIARQTDAQIVPVTLHYDKETMTCSIKFASPMYGADFEDKAEAICHLRDTLATMRWEFWERRGIFQREELDIAEERERMKYSIKEYPPINWEYEESCIYHPYVESKDVFEHLGELLPSRENAFLFRKR